MGCLYHSVEWRYIKYEDLIIQTSGKFTVNKDRTFVTFHKVKEGWEINNKLSSVFSI